MKPTDWLMIPIAVTAVILLVSCTQSAPNSGTATGLPNASNAQSLPFLVTYENGTLTYAVNVTAPTPCQKARADETILESDPVQVRIAITFTEHDPGTVCAQVLTPQTVSGRITIDHRPGNVTITTPSDTYEVTP